MYTLEEKLDQYKQIWLTKENYQYLKKQKALHKENGIKISMAKILNNLLINNYKNEQTGNQK